IGEHYHKHLISHPNQLNRKIMGQDESFSSFVHQTLPSLGTPANKGVVCMYTMSEDKHFIIGHHPKYEEVVIGAGFSGHGFKFAPVIGDILADLAIEGYTNYPVDFLRLSRFIRQ